MATPSLFPQFMKAQAGGGGGPTSVSVIIDGVEFLEPLEVELLAPEIDVDIDQSTIEVDFVEPLEVEID